VRFNRQTASAPNRLPTPESRWSKRAGLHVLHCGPPLSPPPFTTSPDSLLSSADQGTYDGDIHLVEADRFAHSCLDVQRLDILPVFLE